MNKINVLNSVSNFKSISDKKLDEVVGGGFWKDAGNFFGSLGQGFKDGERGRKQRRH